MIIDKAWVGLTANSGQLEFAEALAEKVCDPIPPVADLQGKICLPPQKTDRELFMDTPMGDIWKDANLPQFSKYFWANKKMKVPSEWAAATASFDQEIDMASVQPQVCVEKFHSIASSMYTALWLPHAGLHLRHFRLRLQKALQGSFGLISHARR